MPRKIEISHRTIIFAAVFVVLLWFLYLIRDIILQLFVALVIMAIINPMVTRLSKLKIPRALSVAIVYLLVLTVVSLIIAAVVPPLVDQTAKFVNSLPDTLASFNLPEPVTQEAVKQLTASLGLLPSQILKVGISVFSNILSVLAVFILAFYLLMARNKLDEQLSVLFGKERSKEVTKIIDQLEIKMGGWARAQLIVMGLMGTIFYIGLTLLRIPFAVPLALLVAVLEIVPTIGPILAVIPSVIVAFGISPFTGLAVAALSLLLHQAESYIFVPKVIEKSVGISPLVTLLSLVIGFRLAGVVGALLSVPVVITLQIVSKEMVFKK